MKILSGKNATDHIFHGLYNLNICKMHLFDKSQSFVLWIFGQPVLTVKYIVIKLKAVKDFKI